MLGPMSVIDTSRQDGTPSGADGISIGDGVSRAASFPSADGPAKKTAQVEIVVPVKDEERDLEASIVRLHEFLTGSFPFSAHVTIADNGSTDGTWAIATRLAARFGEVSAIRLAAPGRGRALRAIWSGSESAVLAYMDVDLSTDLNALLPLVAPLLSGHSDVAIGTRLARGARVVRGPRREFISRGYNLLLQATLGTRFSDAQCGFKAIRRECAAMLLPQTKDSAWFFDTELLVLAERAGLRIHEVPVDWVEDPDSRVDIRSTAAADIRGILRMGGRSRLARFLVIGVASTLAYVVVYLALRQAMPAQAANAISLLVTAVANTAVNRRITFGIAGREHAVRHQARGLIAFAAGLVLTSGALAGLHAIAPQASRAAEVGVLLVAGLVATLLRFGLYRSWVFRGSTS